MSFGPIWTRFLRHTDTYRVYTPIVQFDEENPNSANDELVALQDNLLFRDTDSLESTSTPMLENPSKPSPVPTDDDERDSCVKFIGTQSDSTSSSETTIKDGSDSAPEVPEQTSVATVVKGEPLDPENPTPAAIYDSDVSEETESSDDEVCDTHVRERMGLCKETCTSYSSLILSYFSVCDHCNPHNLCTFKSALRGTLRLCFAFSDKLLEVASTIATTSPRLLALFIFMVLVINAIFTVPLLYSITIIYLCCCVVKFCYPPIVDENTYRTMRTRFRSKQDVRPSYNKSNPHRLAAADRDADQQILQNSVAATRLPYYTFGSTSGNKRYFAEGDRKDAPYNYHYQRPSIDFNLADVEVFLDDDYHHDISRFARCTTKFLYTFNPNTAGNMDSELVLKWMENNEVEYWARGGDRLRHPVWNWFNGERVRIPWRPCVRIFGYEIYLWTPWTVTYQVSTRPTRSHHCNVMLVPTGFNFRWVDTPVAPLERFCPIRTVTHNNQTTTIALIVPFGERIEYNEDDEGPYVKIGLVNQPVTTVVNHKTWAYLRAKAFAAADVSKLSCESIAQCAQVTNTQARMILLGLLADSDPTVVEVGFESVRAFEHHGHTENSRPGMIPFMQPLDPSNSYVPVSSHNNDTAMYDERIGKLVARPEKEFPAEWMGWVDQFIAATTIDIAEPCTIETVYAKQDSPAQRSILDQADDGIHREIVKTFQKAEAYQSTKAPRNISQDTANYKLLAAMFAYPLMDGMKSFEWYAFGKSPREVAERVAKICMRAKRERKPLDEDDFSKFDGSKQSCLRIQTFRWIMACYRRAQEYWRIKLQQMLDSRVCRKAKTSNDLDYDTAWTQLSGDMLTSTANTWENALAHYVSLRLDGYSHEEAMERLGTYGGDDGLGEHRGNFGEVCERIGLIVTSNKVYPPEDGEQKLGPTFLSRQFGPDVWEGNATSCCDIKRQVAKLHLTSNMDPNLPVGVKIYEKALSWYITDRNTPIIGEWARAALDRYNEYGSKARPKYLSWFARITESVDDMFPNDGDWMNDYVEKIGYEALANGIRDQLNRGVDPAHLTVPIEPAQYAGPLREGVQTHVNEMPIGPNTGTEKMDIVQRDALHMFNELFKLPKHTPRAFLYVGAWNQYHCVQYGNEVLDAVRDRGDILVSFFDSFFTDQKNRHIREVMNKAFPKGSALKIRGSMTNKVAEQHSECSSFLFSDAYKPTGRANEKSGFFVTKTLAWVNVMKPVAFHLKLPACILETQPPIMVEGYRCTIYRPPNGQHVVSEFRCLGLRDEEVHSTLTMDVFFETFFNALSSLVNGDGRSHRTPNHATGNMASNAPVLNKFSKRVSDTRAGTVGERTTRGLGRGRGRGAGRSIRGRQAGGKAETPEKKNDARAGKSSTGKPPAVGGGKAKTVPKERIDEKKEDVGGDHAAQGSGGRDSATPARAPSPPVSRTG